MAKGYYCHYWDSLHGELSWRPSSIRQGPNHSLASINLADNLKQLGWKLGRFKTGTPPRVRHRQLIMTEERKFNLGELQIIFLINPRDEDYEDQVPLLVDLYEWS